MRTRRPVFGVERDLRWWVAILFMSGSALFALGSFPPYSQSLDPGVVGTTFFVGSVLFTAAAGGQLVQTESEQDTGSRGRDRLWWAAVIQLVGTVLFNVSTFAAMADGLSTQQTNRLVWAPDVFGSTSFIVASVVGWVAVCGSPWCVRPMLDEWRIAAFNGIGSIVFMISAIASLTVPTTGELLNTTLVNSGTFVGAVCFLCGAYLLLPPATHPSTTTSRP